MGSAPSVELECGHLFHFACLRRKLEARWPGARITFKFATCPLCAELIRHPSLKALMRPIRRLQKDVEVRVRIALTNFAAGRHPCHRCGASPTFALAQRRALERLKMEGLDKTEAVTAPSSRFFQRPLAYAMDRFAFYMCFKCQVRRHCGACIPAIAGH